FPYTSLFRSEGEAEAAGDACACRSVRRVLSKLDDEAVPVAAEDEVLLGVGVLAEPGGAGGPGVEHTAAQTGGTEGVRSLGGRPHELAHVHSPRRREHEGTARRGDRGSVAPGGVRHEVGPGLWGERE